MACQYDKMTRELGKLVDRFPDRAVKLSKLLTEGIHYSREYDTNHRWAPIASFGKMYGVLSNALKETTKVEVEYSEQLVIDAVRDQLEDRNGLRNVVIGGYKEGTNRIELMPVIWDTHEATAKGIKKKIEATLVGERIPHIENMDEFEVAISEVYSNPQVMKEINEITTKAVDGLIELAPTLGGQTLTHELVHAASVVFMKENPDHPATVRVHKLFEEVKKIASKKGADYKWKANHMYWSENVYEFMAEALTDPKLITIMAKTKIDGFEGRLSNALGMLLDTMLSMIGLKDKNTAYEILLDSTLAMAEETGAKTVTERTMGSDAFNGTLTDQIRKDYPAGKIGTMKDGKKYSMKYYDMRVVGDRIEVVYSKTDPTKYYSIGPDGRSKDGKIYIDGLSEYIYRVRENIKGSDAGIRPGQADTDAEAGVMDVSTGEGELGTLFDELYGYDQEHGGMEPLTNEFTEFQGHVLNTYKTTASKVNMANIKVELFTNQMLSTAGEVDLNSNTVRIRWNNMSRTARASEILLHEVGHVVSSDVFRENVTERNIMRDMRDSVLASGIDYNVFLRRVSNPSGMEVEIAKRKFDYVFDPSGNPEEFYAYATSNEDVWYATKDVEINTKLVRQITGKKGSKPGKFGELMNKFIDVINKTWIAMTGRGGKGSQVIANMVTTIGKLAAEQEAKKQAEQEAELDKADSKTEKAKRHANKLNDTLSGIAEKKTELLESLKDKTGKPSKKIEGLLRKVPPINAAIESGAVSYLWNTVTTDTTRKSVTELYQVFRQSKGFVEKHTSEIRHAIQDVVAAQYHNIDESTKKAVKRVLIDTDIGPYVDELDKLNGLMKSDEALQAEIKKLERQLVEDTEGVLGDSRVRIQSRLEQINGLAHYMVHGETIVHNQQMNANNIIAAFDVGPKGAIKAAGNTKAVKEQTKHALTKERLGRVKDVDIGLVDKLITLKAIQKTAKQDKQLVSKLMDVNMPLVTDTAVMYNNYLSTMREESKVTIYDPVRKGYSKAEEGVVKYRLVAEDEVESQLAVAMSLVDDQYDYKIWGKNKIKTSERVDKIKPYALVDGVAYYMMTGKVKGTGFQEGAIGLISSTAEGITLSSLIRKNNEMNGAKGILTGNSEARVKGIIQEYSENPNDVKKLLMVAGSTLVPVYNHGGTLVDYRMQMTTVQKEMELDEGTGLDEVLSNTFSRSTKTELTKQYNQVVVDTIIDHSAAGIEENPDDFTLVEEYTEQDKEDGIKYEKRHERWEKLPDYTKEYIFKKLGMHGIAIHKDFVELMTGEKDVTVGAMKIGSFDMKKHPKAQARIMALESYIQEILGHMKRVMILMDAAVVVGNILSNATVAAMHGIDPLEYIKEMKNNWQLLNEYNEMSRKKAMLEVAAKAGKNVQGKIASLIKQIEAHEYHSLVRDGQFTPIAEDINIDAKPDGQLYGVMQDAINKTSMADAINGAKNVLYIDKASKIGKWSLKNTQYQDAMTRRVIQKKMENKVAKKLGIPVEKLSKEDKQPILDYLDQLLVNYGYTMNRYWNFAEKTLGILFLRYYFGQAKAIASMTVKNPLGVILAGGSQQATGVDLYDPMDTYSSSPIKAITNRWMLDDTIEKILEPNLPGLVTM